MKKLLIAIAFVSLFGCTDPRGATETLRGQGFKDIRITGYAWFAGSQDDIYQTGFEATSPAGVQVKGAVCRGLFFKASTIRFE